MTAVLLNNRYQILETLGRGGFGETFLAVDTHMPSARKCVIKQLQTTIEGGKTPNWLQDRFQREAAILEELGANHQQIPQLYAYFSEAGNFFLVQEWIEGITLSQRQEQQGNLPETEVRQILLDLLPVLNYIHNRHIIHRDIKPDNIILRASDNKPVLIDFGIVKEAIATAVAPNSKLPYSAVLGTPGYMASEQAAGRPVYTSDLYSLGLTAIFLLTGKTPQYLPNDSQTGEILWQQVIPSLSPNLALVLDRAVRFHPRDRFTSAQEMLSALQPPPKPSTAKTVAVTVDPPPQPTPVAKTPRTIPPTSVSSGSTVDSEWEEEETEADNPWLSWGLLLLLFLGTVTGGLALGYLFMNRETTVPVPSPSPDEIFQEEPQPFPSSEPPEPRRRPEPPSQPPTTTTTPPETESEPQPNIAPKPENNSPSEPNQNLTPRPKPRSKTPASPKPEPKRTVNPEPKATSSPSLQSTPSPKPQTSPAKPPETTLSPKPKPVSPPPSVENNQPPPTPGIIPEPPPAPPQPKAVPENTP